MKHVHVECLPDEALVRKLGFTKKFVTHHTGKSRVFQKMKQVEQQLALIDEDPGSTKTTYELNLRLVEESKGIKYFQDRSGNKILVLKGKLEDWIVDLCTKANIDLSVFHLPAKPNDLHDVINQRISKFDDLLGHLLEIKNPGIIQLQKWLS